MDEEIEVEHGLREVRSERAIAAAAGAVTGGAERRESALTEGGVAADKGGPGGQGEAGEAEGPLTRAEARQVFDEIVAATLTGREQVRI